MFPCRGRKVLLIVPLLQEGLGEVLSGGNLIPASRSRRRLLLLRALQRFDVNELRLLDKLATRDIQLLLLLGDEADVQRLEVLVHIEIILAEGTAGLILDGSIKSTQTINLHALALQQHLQQTAAELLQHTEHHIGRIQTAMLDRKSVV